MAISVEDINLVKQKAMADSRSAGSQGALRQLFEHLNLLKNPDLEIKFVSGLASADVVAADAACKVYAILITKPAASTTDAWAKGSNHASAAAANGDFVTFLVGTSGGGREYCVTFPDGLPMGTGFTVGSHTTVNGNTKSAAADAWTGFVIIGAP